MSSTKVMTEIEIRGPFFGYSALRGKKIVCYEVLLRALMHVSRAPRGVVTTIQFKKSALERSSSY